MASRSLAVLAEPDDEPEELEARRFPAVPVDPTGDAAGMVICKDKDFAVWTKPTLNPCEEPCVRKHEEKHIVDFRADPDYKDICKTTVPDGETFLYDSCDDQKRYESAAYDVEMTCLDESIPTADEHCKSVMENRRKKLPEFKKDATKCGC